MCAQAREVNTALKRGPEVSCLCSLETRETQLALHRHKYGREPANQGMLRAATLTARCLVVLQHAMHAVHCMI